MVNAGVSWICVSSDVHSIVVQFAVQLVGLVKVCDASLRASSSAAI